MFSRPWAILAHNHIKEHLPKYYRRLKKAGELEAECERMAEAAAEQCAEAVYHGADPDQARFQAMRDHLYIPSEAEEAEGYTYSD